MIILDTDHVSHLEWGQAPGEAIRRYLKSHSHEAVPRVSIISFQEQMRGWLGVLSSAKNLGQEIEIYSRLNASRIFYSLLNVMAFDSSAAVCYQKLVKQKVRIGTMDLKIASTAIANNATLLSCNLKDFSKVPGLKVVDATKGDGGV